MARVRPAPARAREPVRGPGPEQAPPVPGPEQVGPALEPGQVVGEPALERGQAQEREPVPARAREPVPAQRRPPRLRADSVAMPPAWEDRRPGWAVSSSTVTERLWARLRLARALSRSGRIP